MSRKLRNSMLSNQGFLQIGGNSHAAAPLSGHTETTTHSQAGIDLQHRPNMDSCIRFGACLRQEVRTRLTEIRRFVQVAVMSGTILVAGGFGATASATTSYLSPSGSDANPGTSSSPWKTFTSAIPKLKAGDTLVLRDGTYNRTNSGYPNIYCGRNAVSGTSSQRITLQAENERRAFMDGDGSAYPMFITKCAYWTIQGIRFEGGDFASSKLENGHTVSINQSNNIIFRRNLVRFNNRYKNGAIVSLTGSTEALIEENEVYSFHRNGVGGGNKNTYRRNYVNSRNHADISGGLASGASTMGDSGYIFYPSSDNIVENNISERNNTGFNLQATGPTKNNQFYGNISLNDHYGALVTARGSGTDKMPHDNVFINFVVVNHNAVGLNARSAEGTQCQNCSFLGGTSGNNGIGVDAPSSYPGDGFFSFFGTNILATNHSGSGIVIAGDIDQWSIHEANSFAGKPNFNPSSSSNFQHAQSVDPQLGACKVLIPEGSPMKRAGKNGADIGANVLYRYQNGDLTGKLLWDATTGRFPCGAVIAGVNDIAGNSCFDVNKRLNVDANGCSLPAVTLAAPPNLRIIVSD